MQTRDIFERCCDVLCTRHAAVHCSLSGSLTKVANRHYRCEHARVCGQLALQVILYISGVMRN